MATEIAGAMVTAFMIPKVISAVGGIAFMTEKAISVAGERAFTMRWATTALGASASMTRRGIGSTLIKQTRCNENLSNFSVVPG